MSYSTFANGEWLDSVRTKINAVIEGVNIIEPAVATKVDAASNIGAGTGIFSAKVGTGLQFKSLIAGSNVTITSDATTVTISSTGGGGGGATNLAYTASPTQGVVTSDTGTDATIPAGSTTNASLMLPADKTKLDSPALTAIAPLPVGADRIPSFDSAGSAIMQTLTPFARTLIDDTTNTAARLTLGAQEALVSGSNIKTVNGESLLGSGNLVVSGGGGAIGYLSFRNTGSAFSSSTLSTVAPGSNIAFGGANIPTLINTISGASVHPSNGTITLPAGNYLLLMTGSFRRITSAAGFLTGFIRLNSISGDAISTDFFSVTPSIGGTTPDPSSVTAQFYASQPFSLTTTSVIQISTYAGTANTELFATINGLQATIIKVA